MIGQAPAFTVSDFVAALNQSLAMVYPQVIIVGELANFRVSKNMWVYGDLKDEEASVRLFGTTRQMPGPLEDGMALEIIGRPYLHPKFGFSIQIDALRPVGAGALKKAQDLLRQKLEAEGLFDPVRKRAVPFPPEQIGLIASSESAAYTDFFKVIRHRWPSLDVIEYETKVQGVDAPAQIVRAIEVANQRPDLEALVLVRGGGSKDDLAAFDHEQVVRAVAASRIPTVVAIGHERDVSLAELAADVRASTPSNAAELLVPDRLAESAALTHIRHRIDGMLKGHVDELRNSLKTTKQQSRELLYRVITSAEHELQALQRLVLALDPKLPLARGFALIRGAQDELIRTAAQAEQQKMLTVEFEDGTLRTNVEKRVQ